MWTRHRRNQTGAVLSEQVAVQVIDPPRPWVKGGPSPNPKGRPPKGSSFADLMRERLEEVHPIEQRLADDQQREARKSIVVIIDNLIRKALSGDMKAIEMIQNRVDGKPTTTIKSEGEVIHVHEASKGMQQVMGRLAEIRERQLLEAPKDNS